MELKSSYLELREELDDAWRRVMDAGWFILGEELAAFEKEYAAYCGTRHCIGVASGLDALRLCLEAWGIGKGDEVIVPANTYIGTWMAVSAMGAKPVAVDADPLTNNIDPYCVEARVTANTKAIIPVHLYGHPADMDHLNAIARAHGLLVLEDAAQSHGARYRGRMCGSLAHAAAFSFYPSKNLGAFGDGGAVVTDDAQLAERLRVLRNYGSRRRYENERIGANSRLDELQAACLRIKLTRLDHWNERRSALAQLYGRYLRGAADIELPQVQPWAQPAWHLYVIRHPRRDELRKALADNGIGTEIHYPIPPYRADAYRNRINNGAERFPVADTLAGRVLSLPLYPQLTAMAVEQVAEAVKTAVTGL